MPVDDRKKREGEEPRKKGSLFLYFFYFPELKYATCQFLVWWSKRVYITSVSTNHFPNLS